MIFPFTEKNEELDHELDLLRKFKMRKNQHYYLTDIPINWSPGSFESLSSDLQNYSIPALIAAAPVEPTIEEQYPKRGMMSLRIIISRKNSITEVGYETHKIKEKRIAYLLWWKDPKLGDKKINCRIQRITPNKKCWTHSYGIKEPAKGV
jgi:hypothetical protein